jgi:nicotinate-nucleotide--dimethylbenzimidazole phosphoribosyltransferase
MAEDFAESARQAIYEVIARRRDIRHFRPDAPVDDATLARILGAAHQAPSVGYSQPWDFVVIRDADRRARIRESFLRCREAESARFAGERREKYLAYRLEGIVDSALNVCVTVDLRPADEAVLGTTAQPEALRWSACCAVQNLWLAARAEEVGVGWVSIVEPAVLRRELALPPGIEPVAYLCVGRPIEFRERPMLEETGWRGRRPLEEAIHREHFADRRPVAEEADVNTVNISPLPVADSDAHAAALAHQSRLCKPAGSLGRLEEIAAWWFGARGRFPADPPHAPQLFVFAGDHGVVEEGVSAWSSSVTAAMVGNFLSGGAAVNQLARASGVEVTVVDVGVAGDLTAIPREDRRARLVEAKVRAGTRNFVQQPAMTDAEASAAIAVGKRLADEAADAGSTLLCAGEMGIGNTTAAAALLCAWAGVDPDEAVGRGAGVDGAALARKREVVRAALARHRPDGDPLRTLASLGGLEIAAMAGLMLGGAARRVPVVVDGFIAGAAALAATRIDPATRAFLLFAHRSAERGHQRLLEALDATPLFDLGLRLGEGTGAVLAAQLLDAAVRCQLGMATFSTAGVVGRAGVGATSSRE